MNCPFCDRANLDAMVLLEGKHSLVIINRFPATPGHLLVVPREHICSLSELSPEVASEMFGLAMRSAVILRRRTALDGMNIFFNEGEVAGQTCEHIHIHVVPRRIGDDLENFKRKSEERIMIAEAEMVVLKALFA